MIIIPFKLDADHVKGFLFLRKKKTSRNNDLLSRMHVCIVFKIDGEQNFFLFLMGSGITREDNNNNTIIILICLYLEIPFFFLVSFLFYF